ncbi:PAS domain S-box protein [candidate division KSB1 bacterium]|nr:PAS domain S-box protein [candidate division KSB1 bacterium]
MRKIILYFFMPAILIGILWNQLFKFPKIAAFHPVLLASFLFSLAVLGLVFYLILIKQMRWLIPGWAGFMFGIYIHILNEMSLANLTVTLVIQHLIIPFSLMCFAYGLYREHRTQVSLLHQLWESQLRTRLIFENAKDAIFLETIEGRIVDANPAACQLLGYQKAELVRLTVADLVPQEFRAQIPKIIHKQQHNGSYYLAEGVNVHKDGTPIPVEVATNYVRSEQQDLVIAIVRDISERKKQEQSILEQNTRLQVLNSIAALLNQNLEPAPLLQMIAQELFRWIGFERYALYLFDRDTQRLKLIPAASQPATTWQIPSILEPDAVQKFLAPASHLRVYQTNTTETPSGSPFPEMSPEQLLQANGLNTFCLLPLHSPKSIGGVIIGGYYAIRSFTAEETEVLQTVAHQVGVALENIFLYQNTLKSAQELEIHVTQRTRELKQSEERYRLMVESIRDGFCTLDDQLTITYWNRGAETTLGLARHTVTGQQLFRALPGLNQTKFMTAYQMVQAEKKQVVYQTGYNDSHFSGWFSIHIYPWPTGVALFLYNITEHKKAEEDLKTSNRDLESFVYSVSHDLRAPLRAIDGFSKLLTEDFPTEPASKMHHYLDRIRAGVRTMNYLIDDLLAFSRVTRQELKLYPTPIKMVFEKIINEFREQDPSRRLEFELHWLPVIQSDTHLLEILCRNLISNAVKFTRPKPQARIEIGCETLDAQPVIYIKDNGVGFNMKYYDQLFGVFHRLHRADEFEGTGIGLATVKRIVEKHGGQIWAEAIEGEGATFHFTLQEKITPPSLSP